MKLQTSDIQEIKNVLACCKLLDVMGVVFYEGQARGVRQGYDGAIISKTKLTIPEDIRFGVGRIPELEKRLSIFGEELGGEMTISDSNDVKVVQFAAGKSKVQFRCTSVNLIKYPKANEDPAFADITFTKVEAQQVVKAVKTLGAEDVTLQITRDGIVRIFCVDSSNDKFEIELSGQVKYADEETSMVQKYLASMFVNVLDQMSREVEEVAITVGQVGSLTGTLKGHTIIIFALSNEGEED